VSQLTRIILLVVLAAILFVLISPLPELSADSPRNLLTIALFVLVFSLLPAIVLLAIHSGSAQSIRRDSLDLQATLCNRHC